LRDEDTLPQDQLGHVPEEEGQQQGAYVGAIGTAPCRCPVPVMGSGSLCAA
jgi:hypothetical protein